ncbi:MAG: hypothetical protein AAB089_06795 [Nitrospirota bacterium]
MRKTLYVLAIMLIITNVAFSEAIDDAVKITQDDVTIDEIEYYFEPNENPTKLMFTVKITNTSNRDIKFHSNVRISKMSMYIDYTDSKCMMTMPGETCTLRGYGYMKRVDEEEPQIIPANQYYTITASVESLRPPIDHKGPWISPPRPIGHDSNQIIKSIRVIRGE